MKKSKLSKKRKGRGKDPVQTKNVNVDLRDDETIISEMLRSQEINANVTTCADQRRNSGDSNDENTFSTSTSSKDANENSTGLQRVQEENQYLKLLLAMSYKVDQLYEIWNGHFPNAFSNPNTLKTYLDLHSKQKQSDLIVKTFQHVETIKEFITQHKSQMMNMNSTGMIIPTTNSVNQPIPNLAISSGNITSISEEPQQIRRTNQHLSVSNLSIRSSADKQERRDFEKMFSQEGPIQLNVMCHCKGMCRKGCNCRSVGVSCSVRCGCSREKCQSRHLEKNNIVSDIPEEEEEFVDEISDKENANIRDTEVLNIVPIMKSKRIVAPKATVRELADMEMSFASQNILNKKTKDKSKPHAKVRMPAQSPDVTLDCSVLAPRQPNRVFSTPVYQKFKTNHINGAPN